MLRDMIHPQEQQQLPIDDISSPISGPIFYFSDADLFSDYGLQSSEVTSSNCCFDESSNYNGKLNTMPPAGTPTATNTTTANAAAAASDTDNTTPTPTTNDNNNNLSIIFDSPDEIDNDISASIDFSQCQSPSFSVPPFLTQQDHHQFDLPLVQSQIQFPAEVVDGLSQYGGGDHYHHQGFVAAGAPLMGPPPPLPPVFDDDCLSSMPSYVPLNPSSPSCSFLAPSMAAPFMPMNALTADHNSGIFAAGTILTAPHEMLPQDLEFQGDNGGIFCPDSMQRILQPGDLQGLSCENQRLVGGAMCSTPLPTEMSSLEDSTFNKVGKLSVEQRKEKILRYMKKRNERNFSKKIKYACRKTLADSRPRVRGRFAKNDDFGETQRQASINHEYDDDDQVVVKEEEDMVHSSDIFAHINGVNSFECNYSIQSWI
ncbi:hypothetical protein CXB51_006352 [Gossypium anomalum]|uniref:CCT domain-containing protein n=1 Tax=Gossypium anomalum TaxID=47600 RepID=A0A8J6DAC6_9ROSI|nr:hypothetical protein CXB51_006352 [Gossypium anomalum]